MKYTAKKLFHGLVSVRDYTARKCITEHEYMYLHYRNKTMRLTPEDLARPFRKGKKAYYSRFNGQQYVLWDYIFNPCNIQLEMFL